MGRFQGVGDLVWIRLGVLLGEGWEGDRGRITLRRIASSIGVWEAMEERGRLARARTDRRSMKTGLFG